MESTNAEDLRDRVRAWHEEEQQKTAAQLEELRSLRKQLVLEGRVLHEAQAVVLSDGLELVVLVQERVLERRGLSSSSCPSYPSCPSCSSSLVAIAAAPTPSQR